MVPEAVCSCSLFWLDDSEVDAQGHGQFERVCSVLEAQEASREGLAEGQ